MNTSTFSIIIIIIIPILKFEHLHKQQLHFKGIDGEVRMLGFDTCC